ncbi:MAG: translation initiation factor IF-2 N-terminal domain-containing protein [Phycisphaerae bacterium]|nr:translation initiation factor IF-2 N-terminal domain-containing protein [Phycisphaerae bacterium]
MADKMRVHILAKELNVTSKAILDKCAAEGLSVKNHMSTLTAGQTATLREWFSEGTHNTTVEVADRVNLAKVRAPRRRKKAAESVAVAVEVEETVGEEVDESPVAVEAESPAPTVVPDAPPAPTVVETPAVETAIAEMQTEVVEGEAEAPAAEAAPEAAAAR